MTTLTEAGLQYSPLEGGERIRNEKSSAARTAQSNQGKRFDPEDSQKTKIESTYAADPLPLLVIAG